jgi:hypothetical protein
VVHIENDRAFNFFDSFNVLPQLLTVRVAVIDSGVDQSHVELKGRIVDAKSFVGGTVNDTQGHGTFVAGEIAALTDNRTGIAGLAPPARLLVAKVVRDDGSIPPARRRAPDPLGRPLRCEKVINLSSRAPATRTIRPSTASRMRSGGRSTTPSGARCWWWPRSEMAETRRPSPGGSPATRRRCRTCSA